VPFLFAGPSPYTRAVPAISATIITLNEAAHLGEAIASVAWADEIVVVDSGSTDGTVDIARRLATRVEHRDWTGYAAQKNYAASIARHDWVLSLDADERVSKPLARWLVDWREAAPSPRGYRLPRTSWYLGRWIRATDWYPDPQLRLYDRRAGQWTTSRVHESVTLDGPMETLGGALELLHYPYANVSEHARRIDAYTSLAALDLRDRGVTVAGAGLIVHPVAAFLRNYVLRGGFRAGRAGLAISLLNSYYVLLKHVKLLELQEAGRAAGS
jgi:glycosyltransferase involved in cell wall biosynthesis